jgi:hypothetical protein
VSVAALLDYRGALALAGVLVLVELCAPAPPAVPALTLAGLALMGGWPAGRRLLQAAGPKVEGVLLRSRWHFGLVVLALELWVGRTQLVPEVPVLFGLGLAGLIVGASGLAWFATRRFERINEAVVAFVLPGRPIRLGQCSRWWGGFGGLRYVGQADALGARLRDAFVAAIEDAARRWPDRALEMGTHAWVARRVVEHPRVLRHYGAVLDVASDARVSLAGEILALAAWSDIVRGSPALLRRLERRHRRVRIQLLPRSG